MTDYAEDVQAFQHGLRELEGRLLQRVLVNIVTPEFNILYLFLDDCVFALHGTYGSEVLVVRECLESPLKRGDESSERLHPHPPFEIFYGHKVAQARAIGGAWNGHGAEISFEGILDRTMLVQSIYAGEVPEGYFDCLRLGVGHYRYDAAG